MAEGKKGFFGRLVEGLTKTRDNIISGMDSIFSGFSAIDDDFYEEIEETLIMGDLGIQTTMSIVEDLRKKVKEQHIKDPSECNFFRFQYTTEPVTEHRFVFHVKRLFENQPVAVESHLLTTAVEME